MGICISCGLSRLSPSCPAEAGYVFFIADVLLCKFTSELVSRVSKKKRVGVKI